jgi:anti-sigma28 factor (negative regulator of flagellin synthesis)
MNCTGEFELGLMTTERSDQDAFAGVQKVSQVRSTHREDGSLVSPEVSPGETLLDAAALAVHRGERLRRLKEAIDSGRYYVSANDLADRLMTWMLVD